MGLFKTASNAGRVRSSPPSRSNIRGKISGPIPIPDEELSAIGPVSSIGQEETPRPPVPAARRDSAAVSINTALNTTRDEKTNSLAQSGPSHTSTTSTPLRRRTNRSSTLRYSTVSETTDTASPSQKKSTFIIAIGKLFRKRNKKPADPLIADSEARADPPNDHHRSDPVATEQEVAESESEPKRSASLPITEFSRALRSHSIGPDDYMAIHSLRNSLQSDSFLRRRAATTSGGTLSAGLPDDNVDVLGLSPRPASSQGHDVVEEHDPESIGRAVSVDVMTTRRRSRSLSQLHRISESQGLVRKRSEEIRYWRASHIPGPLTSDLSISNRGGPGTTDTTDPNVDIQEDVQPASPPEPFNFGPLANMRITQAVSLEERVGALEAQNQKLERLISQLFQVVPGIDNYSHALRHAVSITSTAPPTPYTATRPEDVDISTAQNAPPGAAILSPSYSISGQSNISFEDEKTFIGSAHPSTMNTPRPISNVTIRGATSLPSLQRDASGAFNLDDYNTLKALLDAERSARQVLERRVAELSHIVETMTQSTYKHNPNPVPDAYTTISAFEHDDDDDDDMTEPPSVNTDNHSDLFETPQEEQQTDEYDAFDEDVPDEADDGSRKRAARTLSLGQLTHGRPKQPQRPRVDL